MNPKELTDADLQAIFADVVFPTPPRKHQLATLAWAFGMNRVSLFHGIGTGKSLTALYLHQLWDTRKLLVVCPNSVVGTWVEQCEQHLKITPTILAGSRDERRSALANGGNGIYVVNYEGLLPLFCDRIPYIDKNGKKRIKAKRNKILIAQANVDGLVSDECHALCSETAIQTKVFHDLSMRAKKTIIMTGTPVSTTEANLWAEYWCLDGGITLGLTKYSFLNTHFKKISFGPTRPGQFTWKIKPNERDKILERVAPVTLRYSREECIDLPPKTYEIRHVEMSAEQRGIYDRVANDLPFEVNGQQFFLDDPTQVGNKLSQIAGGFILDGDGKALHLKTNPKLAEVSNTLDEVDGKALIFHAYVEEGRMLEELCKKKGIRFAALRGEVGGKADMIAKFRDDPKCRVLIAHPKSGGIGVNLQIATVCGFYSNGMLGALIRDQAEGRIWRSGQDRPCLFLDWELDGSLDAKHLHRIEKQADMMASVLEFVKNWRR